MRALLLAALLMLSGCDLLGTSSDGTFCATQADWSEAYLDDDGTYIVPVDTTACP